MNKIIILLLTLVPSLLWAAPYLEEKTTGQPIQASYMNQVVKVINNILDISIPTGENLYSARIVGINVTNSSTPWLQSCSYPSTGVYTCFPLSSLGLTQSMNCSVILDQTSNSACTVVMEGNNSNASVIRLHGQETSRNAWCGVPSFTLSCQRAGNDYKAYKTIRQILIDAGLTFLQ